MNKQVRNQILPTSSYFPYCCPQKDFTDVTQSNFRKKLHKFIKVTISKQKSESHLQFTAEPKEQQVHDRGSNPQIHQFELDKSDFLSMIRKFNPDLQSYKDEVGRVKTMESSKQISSSLRSGENNLSSLLQSLGNDVFSEMFVSSTIKGKILMSGSLGSISEVKSDMEISCPTESLVNGLHFTEDN